jgi:hypothetical protein
MKPVHLYLATSTAIGLTGAAAFLGYGYSHPRAMSLFAVLLLLPFIVFSYLGVLELLFAGDRLRGGGGPEHGDERVPVANTPVELAAHSRSHRPEELRSQPERKAA